MLSKLSRIGSLSQQCNAYKYIIPCYNLSARSNSDGNKTILINGANGNLGTKLMKYWQNTHNLILVDKDEPTEAQKTTIATS